MLLWKLLRQHLKVWRCRSTVIQGWRNLTNLLRQSMHSSWTHTTCICPYSLRMITRRKLCLLHHHLLLLLLVIHRIKVGRGCKLMDLGELTIKGLLSISSKVRIICQCLRLLKLICWVSLWMAVIRGHFFFQNANHRVYFFDFGLNRYRRGRKIINLDFT